MEAIQGDVVVLQYDKLVAGEDLSDQIEMAFSVDGLGVLTVEGVPGLEEARNGLLPLAREFANLPDDIKDKYVHAESYYSFGWSHGKEKLDGNFDLSKGSYYANPQHDRPVDDEDLIAKFPAFLHPNIWPSEDFPALEPAFKRLGQLIVEVGILVSKQCDSYVKKKCRTYSDNKLSNIIKTSLCCKARLLHYYDCSSSMSAAVTAGSERSEHDPFSSWCGWHNDHGSLTGLVSAMFIDGGGNQVQNTDPDAGLYCRSRKSQVVKVSIPPSHVAFQIGETAQIHSGGALQATPHAVRGSNVPGVTRETFAVFMEPDWGEPMNCPEGVDPAEAQSQSSAANLPRGVPSINSRWNSTMDFGEFTAATLNAYY